MGPDSPQRAVMTQIEPLSRRSGSLSTAEVVWVVPLRPPAGDLGELIDEFCRRYPNPKTAADYRGMLRRLFVWSGRNHPAELSEADLIAFCTAGDPANNTVYQRSTKAATFLR
jgi:hypothetical protein